MKYIKTFAIFEADMLMKLSKTSEDDVISLVEELTNSKLNEEEVWDKIVTKLKSVGHDAARKAVMLAMVASAFNGIPAAAASAIQQASGVNVEHVVNPGITAMQAQEAMDKLAERFFKSESNQDQVFLKFSGDIKDVVGIEPMNGYPIFKKGSHSAMEFQKAFAERKMDKGTVDVHGKKIQGTFVVANGLYYPIDVAKTVDVVTDITKVAEVTPEVNTAAAHVVAPGKMVDFSGILGQAAIMFKEQGGKMHGKTMERSSFTFQVIRDTFPSLAQVSDETFEQAFDVHGKFSPKVEVSKLGTDVGQDLQKIIER